MTPKRRAINLSCFFVYNTLLTPLWWGFSVTKWMEVTAEKGGEKTKDPKQC